MTDNLSKEELEEVRELLKEKEILDNLVKKEEAWTWFTSASRSFAGWLLAMGAAGVLLWNAFQHLVKASGK